MRICHFVGLLALGTSLTSSSGLFTCNKKSDMLRSRRLRPPIAGGIAFNAVSYVLYRMQDSHRSWFRPRLQIQQDFFLAASCRISPRPNLVYVCASLNETMERLCDRSGQVSAMHTCRIRGCMFPAAAEYPHSSHRNKRLKEDRR